MIFSPFTDVYKRQAFGLSLSIYLVTGYLRSLPDEIMEASVIDGCGIYKMMWHVVVPLKMCIRDSYQAGQERGDIHKTPSADAGK